MNSILNTVLPVFGMIVLGFGFAKARIFDAVNGRGISLFVFNVAIPALLFKTVATMEPQQAAPWSLWIAFFGGLAPQAPTVIKADWDTINAEVQKTNSLKDMQGSGTQAANDASDRVAAWSKATCGRIPT